MPPTGSKRSARRCTWRARWSSFASPGAPYGSGVALAGLLVLLFLPSLFAWSIAALKEPPYFLIGALACSIAVATMRTQSFARRVVGVLSLCAAAAGLQSIRDGGLIIAILGLGGGAIVGWLPIDRARLSRSRC